MKTLKFNDQTAPVALSIFNIFVSDETKLENRPAIRQSNRILEKLEAIMNFSGDSQNRMITYKGGEICVELDDSDFDKLFDVIKNFKTTNAGARHLERVYQFMEAV